MYHSTTIVGRLGRDPEMRMTPEGKYVTAFSVAIDDGWGDKKSTIWFRVTAWGKQAETCKQYLAKGDKVLVEGRLTADESGSPRIWTNKAGAAQTSYELTANSVKFLSDKSERGQVAEYAPQVSEDEIPF